MTHMAILRMGGNPHNNNPSESLPGWSPSGGIAWAGGEFSEESEGWYGRNEVVNTLRIFSILDTNLGKAPDYLAGTALPGLEKLNKSAQVPEMSGEADVEVKNEIQSSLKPLKTKLSKAERRALQEAQRAAKALAKESDKSATVSGGSAPKKPSKLPSQTKDGPRVLSLIAASDKKGGDRPPDKERKKDVPPPHMQFDDKNRVEKSKRRAVFNQPEARNRVKLFRHLPQYEHVAQLPDLVLRFFQLDLVHPAMYKAGLQYLAKDITGGNACCIAMLQSFKEVIKDYSTPPEKTCDPDTISEVPGRVDMNYLNNWTNKENLQLLNLMYDSTPSDYISMIVTDYGMIPTTSVPVIVCEYQREHLFI